jgi:alkylresorcinol/alkylpyrone synthase
MAFIAASSIKFPPHFYSQEQLAYEFSNATPEHQKERLKINLVFRNAGITGRYLTVTIDELREMLNSFGKTNDRWIAAALSLGEACLTDIFEQTGLEPSEVTQFTFASSTGLAIPSIESRLINKMPLSPYLKRTPMYGLGCAAGAAGIARVADYLRGHPDEAALFLAQEFCSVTFQINDLSLANIVATGLFADASGALLMVGDKHHLARPGLPQIIDSRTVVVRDSERFLGFDVIDTGLKIVLDAKLPELGKRDLPPEIRQLLARNELSPEDISVWLVHPGGPKIIEAVREGMNLQPADVKSSYETLHAVGNISSVSVLHMLDRRMRENPPSPGQFGLIIGLGPGFGAEMVLVKW